MPPRVLWPKVFLTVRGDAPAASRNDAHEWRTALEGKLSSGLDAQVRAAPGRKREKGAL